MRLSGGLLIALLGGLWCAQGEAGDLLPRDHGLRYVGHQGLQPVTVELTLRAQPDGAFEYVQWVMPRSWARWFSRATSTRTRLRYDDEYLVPLGLEDETGVRAAPAGLPPGVLDALAIRLRARTDIARGLRRAEYTVWRRDGALETWTLEVDGAATVATPDGSYQCLKFRLGSEAEWIEGWSAPLLTYHFVKIVSWRDGRKVAALHLDDKQL